MEEPARKQRRTEGIQVDTVDAKSDRSDVEKCPCQRAVPWTQGKHLQQVLEPS